MSNRQHRWLMTIAVAIVGMLGANAARAASVNPFSPTLADIQSLGDSTDATNFSKITAIHVAPDGIHLDVTWGVGQNSDPFSPFFGQNFPRIGVTKFTNGEDGGQGRLLNPPYDGIKWCLMSDLDLGNAQPFLQTPPNWTFYESSVAQPIPGGMTMQMALLSFDAANNFSGITPQGIVHPDAMGQIRSNAFGMQIVGPSGLVPGQTVEGHVWITRWVPEPSSATLLVLGVVGLVGRARRRQG